jgi:hypothetical protein
MAERSLRRMPAITRLRCRCLHPAASIQLIGPANGEELLLATGALVESAAGLY